MYSRINLRIKTMLTESVTKMGTSYLGAIVLLTAILAFSV